MGIIMVKMEDYMVSQFASRISALYLNINYRGYHFCALQIIPYLFISSICILAFSDTITIIVTFLFYSFMV